MRYIVFGVKDYFLIEVRVHTFDYAVYLHGWYSEDEYTARIFDTVQKGFVPQSTIARHHHATQTIHTTPL